VSKRNGYAPSASGVNRVKHAHIIFKYAVSATLESILTASIYPLGMLFRLRSSRSQASRSLVLTRSSDAKVVLNVRLALAKHQATLLTLSGLAILSYALPVIRNATRNYSVVAVSSFCLKKATSQTCWDVQAAPCGSIKAVIVCSKIYRCSRSSTTQFYTHVLAVDRNRGPISSSKSLTLWYQRTRRTSSSIHSGSVHLTKLIYRWSRTLFASRQ
jgi:hypothetical protein